MRLDYERGTIAIRGVDGEPIPYTVWDRRTECWRAEGYRYQFIIDYLNSKGIFYTDNVFDILSAPNISIRGFSLRGYQEDAFRHWQHKGRGVIVIPTAGGKTLVGIKAIEVLNVPTFIVVPTLALIDTWIEKFDRYCLGTIEIGEYTGNKKDIKSITISTYDSAYINADIIGNKFKLLIADEVHHLAAESYRHIAEAFVAPYRMGLTATFYRPDGLHEKLVDVFGGQVYTVAREFLATKGYLAKCSVERIYLDLTLDERREYDTNMRVFREYMAKHAGEINSYQDIVLKSGKDSEAWAALRAHQRGKRIALSSRSKIEKIGELLDEFRRESTKNRIIIFTRYNDIARAIAGKYLIPVITHKTDKEERRDILKKFKDGSYSAIVSSQVLDEGIDVPDANIGIIMSGTGSSREYIQRMGRLLRPKEGKARLYELVSARTSELRMSTRRRKKH